MSFLSRLSEIRKRIELPNNWQLFIGQDDQRWYFQIFCEGRCNVTGRDMNWSGRKWHLSKYMTDGELVQTVLKACLTAAEHEIREQFKYRGVSIFDPHYDIEKLVELRSDPNSIKERN